MPDSINGRSPVSGPGPIHQSGKPESSPPSLLTKISSKVSEAVSSLTNLFPSSRQSQLEKLFPTSYIMANDQAKASQPSEKTIMSMLQSAKSSIGKFFKATTKAIKDQKALSEGTKLEIQNKETKIEKLATKLKYLKTKARSIDNYRDSYNSFITSKEIIDTKKEIEKLKNEIEILKDNTTNKQIKPEFKNSETTNFPNASNPVGIQPTIPGGDKIIQLMKDELKQLKTQLRYTQGEINEQDRLIKASNGMYSNNKLNKFEETKSKLNDQIKDLEDYINSRQHELEELKKQSQIN